MTTISHLAMCDQKTLGWTALQVEEQQGPDLCVTVSELRRAREVYRDTDPRFPKCNCLDIRIKTLTQQIATAVKAGLSDAEALLREDRRELELLRAR